MGLQMSTMLPRKGTAITMRKYTHPNYSYVYVVEMDKSEVSKVDIAKCKEPKETLGSFYNRQTTKPDVMSNCGFFGISGGQPCFTLIDDGTVRAHDGLEKHHTGFGTKIGAVNNLIYGNYKDGGWQDFINGYPVLLDGNGAKTKFATGSELNYNAVRTIVAYNSTKYFLVQVAKPGMKFAAMSKMLVQLGATHAINLDGGGSSRILVKGVSYGKPTENRAVDSVLCFYLKSSSTSTPSTPAADQSYYIYTAVRGDSWWKIAAKHLGAGAKYKELLAFNGLSTNATLQVGQKVKIPSKEKTYTVKKGDSWWKIAAQQLGNGYRYTELAKYNGKTINSVLHPGDVIKIPV